MTPEREEQIAKEWIRRNPHQAMRHALVAHTSWIGCTKCLVDQLHITDDMRRQYQLVEKQNDVQQPS